VDGRARAAAALLALVSLAIALGLFPFDSDGAISVNDGIWWAEGAERYPRQSIDPAHPLFHVVVAGITGALAQLGLPHPGHVATRLVAGAGAAWLLVQILALAGRGRVAAGFLFACAVLSSRGFIVETAAGENVLPAAAAALCALTLAARPGPSLVATGAATAVALWLRQDNLAIVPGIAIALASGLPPGGRLRGACRFLLATGLVTLLGYFVFWMVATRGVHRFDHWLPSHGFAPFMGGPGLSVESLAGYASSIVRAATGQTWPIPETRPWLGLAIVGVLLVAAFLLRGREARTALGGPMLAALACWSLIHAWFEPHNFEWLMLPLAFLAAFGAALARGAPVGPLAIRVAGGGLLAGLIAVQLAVHGPTTWKLRERQFMSAIEDAAGSERAGVLYVAHGVRAGTGLMLTGVSYTTIPENRTIPSVLAEFEGRAQPIVIVTADRLVLSGMPEAEARRRSLSEPFDLLPDKSGLRFVRRQGLVCAIRIDPANADTKPKRAKPG
jgi:hypothetical protein